MHVYCSKALSVVFHGLYREGSPRYTGDMRSCAICTGQASLLIVVNGVGRS